MNQTPSPYLWGLSRRRVLQVLGLSAGSAAVLAACGGDGNGTAGGGGGGDGGPKPFHGAWPFQVPPKGHFNVMTGVTDRIDLGAYFDLIFLPGGLYYWDAKEWEKLLAEDWAFDNEANTFTYTIKSGLTWNDGSAITSRDVLSTFWGRRIMRQTEWGFINKMEATDDQTVVFTMNKPSTVVERYVLRAQIFPDAMYGEFAQRGEELFAGGDDLESDEGQKLNEELQAYRPENPEADVLTSGPFRYDFASITNAQLTLAKNEKGFAADVIKFDSIVLYNGETPDVTPVVLAGDVDYATHGFPPATEKEFVNRDVRILRPPVYSGPSLDINLDALPEFQDVLARRALAHVINRKDVGTVALAESGVPVQFMAGFSDVQVPDWLTAEEQAQLDPYELDPDKAADLLEQAGWTKQGDEWHKPDGGRAKYELSYPAEFADNSAAGENVASQLTDFGIAVTGRGVTFTQHPIDVDKGNFEFAIRGWGSSTHPHPHFAFVQDFFVHNFPIAANQGGKGIAFELTQTTEAFGAVDLEEIVNAAGEGLDEEEQKQNVLVAATAFNELLPILPLYERYGNNPALEGVRVKAWPPDDDPIMLNAPYSDNFTIVLMFTGDLEPV